MHHFSRTLLVSALFLTACSDNATVVQYDKDLTKLECLRLSVFPPDPLITTTLEALYPFKEECPYRLQVSKKTGITCNSNQNAPKKALSNFPNGYIRMDIYKEKKLIYSYYRDLNDKISKTNITDAFTRVQKDLL